MSALQAFKIGSINRNGVPVPKLDIAVLNFSELLRHGKSSLNTYNQYSPQALYKMKRSHQQLYQILLNSKYKPFWHIWTSVGTPDACSSEKASGIVKSTESVQNMLFTVTSSNRECIKAISRSPIHLGYYFSQPVYVLFEKKKRDKEN